MSSTSATPRTAPLGRASSVAQRSQGYLDSALRELFDVASVGVLVVNGAGHRVYSNAALNNLIGANACLPLGTSTPPSYVPLDQREKFSQMLDGVSSLLGADESGAASPWLELLTISRGRIRAKISFSSFTHLQGGQFTVLLFKFEPALSRVSAADALSHDGCKTRDQAPGPGSAETSQRKEALTKREKDVLWLLLDGRRVSSIARSLYLSEHTVRNHLKAIFRKLGAHSQTELVDRFRPVNRTSTTTAHLLELSDPLNDFRQDWAAGS